MKKYLLSLLVVLMVAGLAAGEITIKGGFTFTDVDLESSGDSFSAKYKMGFALGLGFEWLMGDTVSFAPEILYVQKNSTIDEFEDWDYELGVFEFPLIFKFHLTDSFRLYGGPSFSYIMTAKADGDDVDDDTKNFDYGLVAGAQFVISETIGIEARYNWGFADISEWEDAEVKTRSIYAFLSFTF